MAGNWKMQGTHLEAIALVQKVAFGLRDRDFDTVDVVVLPPFTALRSVQTLVGADKLRVGLGAQDISAHPKGAYTGEVSAGMLAKLDCRYVVVGHSERRQHHGEDDATVNAKAKAALGAELVPIVCVGEGQDARGAGEQVPYTLGQLDAALAGVADDQVRDVVVAYEPVWAIGTGEVATPQDAQEVCAAIRGRLDDLYPDSGVAGQVRILYGGSVKVDNIAGIMEQPDVDGALVGGASLDASGFVKICRFWESGT